MILLVLFGCSAFSLGISDNTPPKALLWLLEKEENADRALFSLEQAKSSINFDLTVGFVLPPSLIPCLREYIRSHYPVLFSHDLHWIPWQKGRLDSVVHYTKSEGSLPPFPLLLIDTNEDDLVNLDRLVEIANISSDCETVCFSSTNVFDFESSSAVLLRSISPPSCCKTITTDAFRSSRHRHSLLEFAAYIRSKQSFSQWIQPFVHEAETSSLGLDSHCRKSNSRADDCEIHVVFVVKSAEQLDAVAVSVACLVNRDMFEDDHSLCITVIMLENNMHQAYEFLMHSLERTLAFLHDLTVLNGSCLSEFDLTEITLDILLDETVTHQSDKIVIRLPPGLCLPQASLLWAPDGEPGNDKHCVHRYSLDSHSEEGEPLFTWVCSPLKPQLLTHSLM